MRNLMVLASTALVALAGCSRKPSDAPRAPAPPSAAPASRVAPHTLPVTMPQRAPGLWAQKRGLMSGR